MLWPMAKTRHYGHKGLLADGDDLGKDIIVGCIAMRTQVKADHEDGYKTVNAAAKLKQDRQTGMENEFIASLTLRWRAAS